MKKIVYKFVAKYGMPVKMALEHLLPNLIPGGYQLVQLLSTAWDSLRESSQDAMILSQQHLNLTKEDILRLENILEVIYNKVDENLIYELSAVRTEDQAKTCIDQSLITDPLLQQALQEITLIARDIDYIKYNTEKILKNQGIQGDALEEILLLVRLMAGQMPIFINESQSAIQNLPLLQQNLQQLFMGDFQKAKLGFQQLSVKDPQNATAFIGLSIAEAVEQDWQSALKSLTQARQLRPQDTELESAYTQVTRYTQSLSQEFKVIFKEPQIGDTLEGWTLEAILGVGGFGKVFKATQGQKVAAIKVLHPKFAHRAEMVKQFKNEILALKRLPQHPNLVHIEDFDKSIDWHCWYIQMQWIEGASLENILQQSGAFSSEQAVKLGLALADALNEVHQQGILHRDIKPQNILITSQGQPVLIDFGLAGLEKQVYSKYFAAPEQIHEENVYISSDIYALAAVLYYILAFNKVSLPKPYHCELSRVPPAWHAFFQQNLHSDPSQRAQAMSTVVQQLNAIKSKQNYNITHSSPAVYQNTHHAYFPLRLGIAIVSILIVILGILFFDDIKKIINQTSNTSPMMANIMDKWMPGHMKTYQDAFSQLEFIKVNKGCFYIGSPLTELERKADETQKEICIEKDFYIGTTEVTFAAYDQFAKATLRALPDDQGWGRELRPVINVSWQDAVDYANWLSAQTGKKYRLPTEAEWEYVARAETKTAFWWGNTITPHYANYNPFYEQSISYQKKAVSWWGLSMEVQPEQVDNMSYQQKTLPIKSFAANAWGVYEIHGNVWEWTCSHYSIDYIGYENVCTFSENPYTQVSARGGAWDEPANRLRAAERHWNFTNMRNAHMGFRLVREF